MSSQPFSGICPVVGGRYNWKNQPERLVYMGTKRYPGDPRTWHQFAKIEEPETVWSEVLTSDLENFEKTPGSPAPKMEAWPEREVEPAVLPNPNEYGKQRAQWKRETTTRFRR